jgi:hypothetical protein
MYVLCSTILPLRNPGIHPRHDLSPIGTFDIWKKVLHCKDCQVYGLILRISRDIDLWTTLDTPVVDFWFGLILKSIKLSGGTVYQSTMIHDMLRFCIFVFLPFFGQASSAAHQRTKAWLPSFSVSTTTFCSLLYITSF